VIAVAVAVTFWLTGGSATPPCRQVVTTPVVTLPDGSVRPTVVVNQVCR
jgi:hypothetical protein